MEGPFFIGEVEHYRVRLDVATSDHTTEWLIRDETLRYGLGYSTPRPFHWSDDGRHLYYTDEFVADGCALFANGFDLYRLDLADGTSAEVVPPGAWWVSISPDERTAAYIRWNGTLLEIVTRDIEDQQEHRAFFDPSYEQGGAIVWSPDSKHLALTLASHACQPPDWTQAIVRIDVVTLSQTLLFSASQPLLRTREWPDPDTILLADDIGNAWTMDANTGQVEPSGD